jgi:lipoate-protein ligase A
MIKGRFIADFAGGPDWNMAVDEWLLGKALAGSDADNCAVWLRLYSWRPGAITFGRNQCAETALDWSKVGKTPVIRRVTGGRALYHDESELTYAIAADLGRLEGTPLGGSIAETGQVISEALVEFLRSRGVESQFMRHSSSENARPGFFHKAPCFASHARHEIKSAVGKVVASAQRRVGRALLQHGAIKLSGVVRHPALGGVGECEEFDCQAVTLAMVECDGARLVSSFARVLGMEFGCESLASEESEQVRHRSELVRKNRLNRREILNSISQ